MKDLYQNKYRSETTRLQSWDYATTGMYFVTMCTANRAYYFGNDNCNLTELGKIAESEWVKSITIRPDMNLNLGEFVVMPNHFHGIVGIGKNSYNKTRSPGNEFGPQSKNLASIIRGYKSAVTTYARKNNIPFGWQPLYYDRIIRSMEEYKRVSFYIYHNPRNWIKDKLNSNNSPTNLETNGWE